MALSKWKAFQTHTHRIEMKKIYLSHYYRVLDACMYEMKWNEMKPHTLCSMESGELCRINFAAIWAKRREIQTNSILQNSFSSQTNTKIYYRLTKYNEASVFKWTIFWIERNAEIFDHWDTKNCVTRENMSIAILMQNELRQIKFSDQIPIAPTQPTAYGIKTPALINSILICIHFD